MTDASPVHSSAAGRLYWACQIGGWGAYAASKTWAALFYLHLPWLPTVTAALILHGAALGLTHALRGYVRRRKWPMLPRGRLALRIVVAGLVLGVPFGFATSLTPLAALHDPGILEDGSGLSAGPGVVLLLNTINWAFVFMIWLTLYFGALAVRQFRAAELRESELARALQLAELRLLKSQLNPHFLFNALNAVRSLIAHDPARAQDAVTRLANTLRYTLSSAREELVSLAQELEIVQDYLDLESLRLEDRLSIDCEVSAEARAVRIPVMLLQTVVENAIKHGIAELPGGGVLRVHGELRDDMLILEVENPRPLAPPPEASEGIGLRNAAERLRLLFGERASLDVDLSRPDMATTKVRIPVRA
jgi:two-component system sensor histidine kinase AlgZ